MDNLELLKKRMQFYGGNAEGRIHREKLKSLEGALKYSYQAETIIKDGIEYRALLNNNKLKADYDDKIISIPHDSQMKVGDLFYWPRTNSHWLVYLQQYTEDAYFRGYVRKAEHTMRWKDSYGNVHEVAAAVRGPVETKIRSQMKSGISFDEPNYTLATIVPANEFTNELKRYSRVTIHNKPWEVVATDSISEVGVIEIQLTEDYLNREEDTSEVVGGKLQTDFTIVSCLDDLKEVKINTPIELWTEVLMNGKLSKDLIENSKYLILEGDAKIVSNKLTLSNTGIAKIILDIPKIKIRKEFILSGVEQVVNSTLDLDILGDGVVKSYGSSIYTVVKYENGVKTQPTGEWAIEPNNRLFRIKNKNNDTVEIEWVSGMSGSVTLKYIENGKEYSKSIEVESLL